nr:unnamed protein product [Callosobruchus analis]
MSYNPILMLLTCGAA